MLPLLRGMAIGALGVFLLDPQQGRRRRALLRDQVIHGMRKGGELSRAASRDISFRARGAAAALARLRRGDHVSDDVLIERVRARLGRYVSHPRAIQVSLSPATGAIMLTGDVLTRERAGLLRAVGSVRGVRGVEDLLIAHERADVPSLQGGKQPSGEPPEFLKRSWSPAARAASGGTGAALLVYAFARGGLLGVAALAMGAVLLARTGTNRPRLPRQRARETAVSGERETAVPVS